MVVVHLHLGGGRLVLVTAVLSGLARLHLVLTEGDLGRLVRPGVVLVLLVTVEERVSDKSTMTRLQTTNSPSKPLNSLFTNAVEYRLLGRVVGLHQQVDVVQLPHSSTTKSRTEC